MTRSRRQASLSGRTMRRRSAMVLSSAATLIGGLVAQRASGASGTWNQPFGGSYNFADSANWLNGSVPNGTDDIADFSRFNFQNGDIIVNLASGRTIGQLLAGDLDTSSAVNFIFNGPGALTLSSSVGQPVLNIASMSVFGNFVRFDNPLAGTNGFNKQGAGLLVLNGINTYSSATTISAGTVRVSSAANLGSSTVLLNGGTLDLRNDVSTNFGSSITLAANSQINVDSVVGSSAQNQTHTIGAVNFGAAGTGRTLTITNFQPNTTSPLVSDNNFFNLATGVVTLNDSGTLVSSINGSMSLGGVTSTSASPTTLTIAGSNGFSGNVTINGAVTQGAGPLALTFTNNRTLILAGALSHTGGTNITGGGTIQLAPGITMPSAGPVTITNGTLDLNGNSSTVATLTMGGNNGTILTGAGTLTLGGNVFFTGGAGTANILGNLNLGAVQRTFNITQGTSGTPDMVINGPVGDSGAGFIKAGTGTLRLTGNNTSTGAVAVNGGTLQADARSSGSSLGSGPMNIAGGTLRFANVGSGAAGTTGTLSFAGANSSGTLVIDAAGNGATGLNFAGFAGRSAGATGLLTIVPNTGALDTNESLTLTSAPTGSLLVNGILPAYVATQNSGSDNALDFLTVNGSNHIIPATAVYAGSIGAGPNAVVALNSGTDIGSSTTRVFALKLTSGANVSGSGGTLIVGDDTNPGGIILDNGAGISASNLAFGPTGASEGIIWAGGSSATVSSSLNLHNTLTTGGAQPITFSGPFALSGTQNVNVNGATTTISGQLAGGGLTKIGPGLLVLSANNSTYSGTLTANAGTLQVGDGGTNGAPGSGLIVTNSAVSINRSDLFTLPNNVSGSGSLIQAGSGTLVLTGALSYTGNLTVSAGTAKTSGATRLPSSAGLIVDAGTFDLNGLSQTVGTLSNNSAQGGFITSSIAGPVSLTVGGNANGSFNGAILNGTGSVALIKSGSGTFTFNPSSVTSTYTGGTTISGGVLYLGDGSLGNARALSSGSITLSGGTLALATAFNSGGGSTNLTNALFVPAGKTGGLFIGQVGSSTGAITGGDSTSVLNVAVPPSSQYGFGSTTGRMANNVSAFTGQINAFAPNGPGALRLASEANAATLNTIVRLNLNDNVTAFASQNPPNGGATASTKHVYIGELTGTSLSYFGGSSVSGRFVQLHVGSLNTNSTFNGVLQDSLNAQGFSGPGVLRVDKIGTGTWTLTNQNTYTGATSVSAGVLSVASGGNLAGTPTITINAGATLNFAGTGTIAAFNGTGGNSQIVNNGNLNVPAGFSTPKGVYLGGTGTVLSNGGAYVHNAGTINPNTDGTAGILTFANDLTLSPGSNTLLDLQNPAGANVVGGVNDLIKVLGNFTLNSPSTASSPVVRVNFLGTAPAAGDVGKTFPFLTYGTSAGTANLSNVQVVAGFRGTLGLVPDASLANTLDVKILSVDVGVANLTWTGVSTSAWDLNTTANWKKGTTPTTYFNGDNVAFLGDAINRNVALGIAVSPGSILIDSALDYTFTGAGTISGAASLTKNNTGVATINLANTFTGGTTINGGTLALMNPTAAGTGSITLNDGATLYAGANLINNVLNVGAANAGTLFFPLDNNASFTGNIVGGGNLKLANVHSTSTGNSNLINLGGNLDAFTGTIDLTSVATPTTLRMVPPGTSGAGSAIFNLGQLGATLQTRNGGTYTIGGLVGGFSGTLAGAQTGTAASTYVIGSANVSTEFDGAIINQGPAVPTNIVKVGTATLTLGGANTYTGTTVVNAGTLFFNSSSFNGSSFTVNSGGTLAISGVNFNAPATTLALNNGGALNVTQAGGNFSPGGSVTLIGTGGTVYGEYNHSQGTISPGTGVLTIGTINFNDTLHLNGGTVQFDLNTNTAVGSGTNDLIAMTPTGVLDLQSPTPLFVNFLTAPANNSDYTLLTFAPGHGPSSLSNLTLNSRANGGLTFNNADPSLATAIMLHINSFSGATLTWNGTGDNNWDVVNHANWKDAATTTDKFFQQDNVVFDDTAGVQQNIQINTPVIPSSVLVNNNTNNYTFQGTGTITGGASLTKNGSGTLTIANSNSYTGGTNINQGTLAVISAQPFIGTATISNGAALAAVEQGDQTLSFGSTATYVIPSAASGTISLISNNSGSQTTGVNVGIIMNGTLTGGTAASGATANFLVTNTNTGASSPVLTDINSNNGAFAGTINILNNGTTTVRLGGSSGSANAFFNLTDGGTLAATTGTTTISFGGISGGPDVVLQGFRGFNAGTTTNAAGGPVTYQIGSLNVDSSFAGAIVNGTGTNNSILSLTKFGTAKLTLSGTNTYTGATTISGGTLVMGATGSIANSPTISLSGGALDVTANASGYTATSSTITGSGTIYGNVTHNTGTIIPGAAGTVGTITVSNNLTLNADIIASDVATLGTVGVSNDLLDVGGALTLTGTSTVNASFLQNPQLGSYPLIRSASRTGSGTITLGALGFRGTASLDFSSPTVVNLAITSLTPASLTWRGAGNNGGLWDVNTTANWINGSGTADKFFQSDAVAFTDVTGAPTAVIISSPVSPSSIAVSSSTNNYTFSATGTGVITGPGVLTKSGGSTLTVTMANTYIGGTNISAGTIAVGSLGSSALGTGTLNLKGGALNTTGTGTVTLSSTINAAAATSSTLSLNGTGAVAAITGNLTGTGTVNLVSDNTGKLFDITGSNSTFGGSVVLQGTQTIRLGSQSGSGAALFSLPGGGTLATNAGTTSSVTVIPLGALSGVASSTLYGYRAGGTGGNIAYQIGDANQNAVFAGNVVDGISGATARPVTIIKSGAGQQTLSGSNSYTGGTQVLAGTLALVGINSWTPALTGTSPTILNGGRLVFDYSTNAVDNPANTIKTILGNEAAGNFLTGQLRTTNADDGRHAIGWIDAASKVTVAYTYRGDANVDGMVTTSDFTALSQHFNSQSAVWADGDFNYDGKVNALDFNALATNFGATAIPAPALSGAVLGSLVPEPTSIALLGAAAAGLLSRRRRRD